MNSSTIGLVNPRTPSVLVGEQVISIYTDPTLYPSPTWGSGRGLAGANSVNTAATNGHPYPPTNSNYGIIKYSEELYPSPNNTGTGFQLMQVGGAASTQYSYIDIKKDMLVKITYVTTIRLDCYRWLKWCD